MSAEIKRHARKKYFIDKKFQSRFILKFCLLVIVAGVATSAILYLLAANSTTVSIVNSRVMVRSTMDFLLPLLAQTFIVVTVLAGVATIIVALLVSHRIAGPLYRFKKVIKTLEEGDFTSDFSIRKFDQLKVLADAFNEMAQKNRKRLAVLKSDFAALKARLEEIPETDIPEIKRAAFKELKKQTQSLHELINYFKS